MDWFFSLPAVVRILSIFVFVVAMNSRGLHLGVAAIIGSVAIALWSGTPLSGLPALLAGALFTVDTMLLSVLLALILCLSSIMKKSGAMGEVVSSYRALVKYPRFALSTLPLVIGVLPVPGGAVFSAPMVGAIDEKGELTPATRAAANYWFRHCIELVWPLYPAFILTCTITGLPLAQLCAANLYAPFVLIFSGILFLIPRSFGKGANEGPSGSFPLRLAAFAAAFSPVLMVLACAVSFGALWSALSPSIAAAVPALPAAAVGRYLPAIIGVAAAIALVLRQRPGIALRSVFPFKEAGLLIGTVAGIRVFSMVLDSLGLASAVSGELASLGVPAEIVTAALPFIAGLVLGIGFGYVGVAFPIVVSLAAGGAGTIPSVVLAGAFGFSGMMLSPLHVCAVVSAEHFSVKAATVFRKILPSVLLFLAVACAYYAALKIFL